MIKRIAFVLSVLLIVVSAVHGDYREEFEKGFLTKTWSGEQPAENFCIECHSSDNMKPELLTITEEWKASWHAQHKIACHNCHGGDPKDASLAMSPHRGFVGKPTPSEVPDFCGKCHIGIVKQYWDSGHGKAFRASGKGPTCITCHGSHNIQKAHIDIINEQRCSKCHSYERARTMKQTLFLTEKKIGELETDLARLKSEGVFIDDETKNLFSVQAEFRTLFHSIDVDLIKNRTDEFSAKISAVDGRLQNFFRELLFRRNFSAFILLVFTGFGVTLYLITKTPKE